MATVVIFAKFIQGVTCNCIMNVLLDSGGSTSMIGKNILVKGVNTNKGGRFLVPTLVGQVNLTGKVQVQSLCLPKFDKSLVMDNHDFLTFNAPCKYDMLLGSNFLSKYGVNLNFKKLKVKSFGNTLPMNTAGFTKERQVVFFKCYILAIKNDKWYKDDNDGIDFSCYSNSGCQI